MADSGANYNDTEYFDNIQFENNATTWPTTRHSGISNYSYYNDSNSVIFNEDSNTSVENSSINYYSDNNGSSEQADGTASSIIMDAILTTTSPSDTFMNNETAAKQQQIVQFWIGVGLSIASSLFIGVSFIIKKKALIRLSKGGKRANQGGYGYLKDLLWWGGLLSMAVGEAANFMAYTFAPASLVSTLGVLSVLVTAILSSKYLRERLNFLGKIGCFLCAIGSTVIVIHAPMEKEIESMEDLQSKLANFIFVLYVLFTIVISLILIYHYRPKLPETSTYTLLIWIGVCSMIGSLSVMSVKGLGLAMMLTVSGIRNELGNWLTWFCFVTLFVCISVQMNFLNKALDTFNTAVVTPIYYVFFTTCVIIASAILFNEFANLPITDWVGLACGFFTVLTAIALLHLCKNFDFTLVNLAQQIDFVNNSHSSASSGHFHGNLHHEPVKGESLSLPFPSTSASTTSCAIPAELKIDLTRQNGAADRVGTDDDESDTEELYKSVDSTFTKKGASISSLSPDSRLLSNSFSNSLGGRNRDGYIPLTYGTTDNSNANF